MTSIVLVTQESSQIMHVGTFPHIIVYLIAIISQVLSIIIVDPDIITFIGQSSHRLVALYISFASILNLMLLITHIFSLSPPQPLS